MKKLTLLLLPLTWLLPSAAQDVRLGLVSYWPLDEVSGDGLTTPDKAGYGSDLTLENMDASNLVAGRRGSAMTFDGVNELLFANTAGGPNPGLPLQNNVRKTICMWIKGDGVAQAADKRIFAEASSVSNAPMFNLGTDNAATGRTGKADIYIRADDSTATVNHTKSTGSPLDGNWHHLAVTDNNGVLRFYIDGVLDAAAPSYTRPTMTLDRLSIGGIKRMSGSLAFFTGTVDDVAVWSRVLTAAEIQNVMANGLVTPVPPALVFTDRPGPYLQGDRVMLSVEARGTAPNAWQWKRNGTDIPGATESTYVIPALTAATQGDYSVVLDGGTASSTVSLAFTADPPAAVSTNLVSWWPFNALDENPFPPTTPDPWGANALSCQDIDSSNLVPGKFGKAMEFDGISEIAYRTSGFPISSNNEYSVSLWVKGDGTVQSDLRVFAEGSNTSNTPLFGIGTVTDGSSHLRMFLRSDSNVVLVNADSQTNVFDDNWHHVVWTDRNGQARLYVDGVLDGTNFGYNRSGQTLTLNQTSVGAIQRAAASHWNHSTVDDVAVWNRALTWTEIQSIMTAGVPAPVTAVPPDITSQPAGRTLWAGRAVSLSVQATGTGPLTFEWRKDGNPVANGPEPTLIIEPATAADSGSYTCKVTGPGGTKTSNPAVLTVKAIAGLDTGRLNTWPLDAVNGTTTPDTLSARDLTLVNMDASSFATGLKNGAAFLDGLDDELVHTYSGTGSDTSLSMREEFTVAFWVRGNGVGQLDRRVFSESSVTNTNPLFNMGTDDAGVTDQLEFYIRSDTGGTLVNHKASLLPVFDGFWHHVIYTDYKGQGQLYVDGNTDTSFTYARPVSAFSNVSIGGIARATPSHWFAGGMDEVNTWERGLSADEALQLYQSYPKPASVFEITGVTSPGQNQLQLTVSSSHGNIAYRVDSTTSLTANSWTAVNDAIINPVANGAFTVDLTINPASTQRLFYRVVVP